jgi:hypothetical protein
MQHGLKGALRNEWIGVAEALAERFGNDLPADTELISAPSTVTGRPTVADEAIPEFIDFILGVAKDLKRNRGCVGEVISAVQRDEGLSEEFKGDGLH